MKRAHVALFIAIVSVSFAAVLIVSTDAEPLTIAFYRMLFTMLLLAPFFVLQRYRRELAGLARRDLLGLAGIGVVLAAHFAFWISSLDHTSVASSVILVTAHPVLVAPLAYHFFQERVSRVNVGGIALSLLGVVVLVGGNYDLEAGTLYGNLLAMLGGAAAGVYILGGRRMRHTLSTPVYALTVYGVATVVLAGIVLVARAQLTGVGLRSYGLILAMALVPGIFGHTLYNWALKYVRASVASVSLLGEPLGSTMLAFALPWIHQVPSWYTLAGGTCILLGIYLASRTAAQPEPL
ncbi:MAG: DMT family transporter [Thermoplasmatota archaeon]